MLLVFAACKDNADDAGTTISEVADPENKGPTNSEVMKMDSYYVYSPTEWSRATSSSDPNALTLYATRSVTDANSKTTTIDIKVEKNISKAKSDQMFAELLKAKSAQRSNGRIGGILCSIASYDDAGVEVQHYQVMMNSANMMVIEVRAENEETKPMTRLVLQSISFK